MVTTGTRLTPYIPTFSDALVACVGDVMLDCFAQGEVHRVSPEAPIPILSVVDETFMLGGAGNVVRNLAGLGTAVRLLTVLGEDAPAETVMHQLTDLKSVTSVIEREPGRRTGLKTRYHAAGQHLLRVDREGLRPIGSICAQNIIQHLPALLDGSHAAILSDYGKGVLTKDIIQAVIREATSRRIPIVVDPKTEDFSLYRGASVITPNRKELAAATRQPVHTDTEVVEAARIVIAQYGITHVLVTRSEDGMTRVSAAGTCPNDEVAHFPARAREVYDVSGAGDTVVATLAAGLAAGVPLDEAIALSNVSAGLVVGKAGTATVTSSELIDALRDRDLYHAESCILDSERALNATSTWREAGLTVGFTNGCFDLLHPGHLSLLRQARGQCDRLIVAVNSDHSVRRLKGPQRPIQPETTRALVLASLETVDAVVIFNEETPADLITSLQPDVLIKGADYTRDTVVGADIVLKAGGTVFLADLEPDQSTTGVVRRILQQA